LTGSEFENAKTRDLPLNLVLTFFSELANDVIANPGNDKFSHSLDKLKVLGNLSNPKIANYFAVNYRKYGGFRNVSDGGREANEEEIARAKNSIVGNEAVQRSFNQNIDSIKSVFDGDDGGVDFLFQQLLQQIENSDKFNFVEDKIKSLGKAIIELVKEALPDDVSEAEKRKQKITLVIEKLQEASTSKEKAEKLSRVVMNMSSLEPESILPVPTELSRRDMSFSNGYLNKCFLKWRSDKMETIDFSALNLEEKEDFSFLLSSLSSTIEKENLSAWLRKNFGSLRGRDERSYARRFVCLAISDHLSGKNQESNTNHNPIQECVSLLRNFTSLEVDSSNQVNIPSPHYYSIIKPFINRLSIAAEGFNGQRGELPSDRGLRIILENSGMSPAENKAEGGSQ
jgi:hypothetical protein